MKRKARLHLPSLALDRDSRRSLHAQIYDHLRRAIASGTLPARLPSTRSLAAHLGVSRNTVMNAYEALALDGILEARTGSGTWRKAQHSGLLSRADLVRDSHYPFGARHFRDPDGNALYFHR